MFLLKRAKREKLTLTTLIATAVFAVLTYVDVGGFVSPRALAFIGFVVVGWLVWWAIGGGRNFRYIAPVILPIYVLLGTAHKLALFIGYGYGSLLAIVVFGTVFHVTLLALNVLFVSGFKKIPLRQAGFTTLYFIDMLMFFAFGYEQISTMERGSGLIAAASIWLVATLLGFSYLYFVAGKAAFVETAVFSMLSAEILLLINMWPANRLVALVVGTGMVFIVLGVLEHHLKRDMTAARRREYLILAFLLLATFFLF